MDHLEKSSEGTPYEEAAHKMVHFYHTKEASLMDTPEHVAKVVKRIVEAKHLKTRYQNNIISKTLCLCLAMRVVVCLTGSLRVQHVHNK